MRLLIGICAASILAAPLTAQVHPGVVVRVRAPTAVLGRFEGIYLGRTGDTLLLGSEKGGPVRVPVSAITRLEVSQGKSRARGFLRGALWGATISGVLGALVVATAGYDPTVDGPHNEFLGTMILGGAELGGIIGLFVPMRMWTDADPHVLLNSARARRPMSAGLSFSF